MKLTKRGVLLIITIAVIALAIYMSIPKTSKDSISGGKANTVSHQLNEVLGHTFKFALPESVRSQLDEVLGRYFEFAVPESTRSQFFTSFYDRYRGGSDNELFSTCSSSNVLKEIAQAAVKQKFIDDKTCSSLTHNALEKLDYSHILGAENKSLTHNGIRYTCPGPYDYVWNGGCRGPEHLHWEAKLASVEKSAKGLKPETVAITTLLKNSDNLFQIYPFPGGLQDCYIKQSGVIDLGHIDGLKTDIYCSNHAGEVLSVPIVGPVFLTNLKDVDYLEHRVGRDVTWSIPPIQANLFFKPVESTRRN